MKHTTRSPLFLVATTLLLGLGSGCGKNSVDGDFGDNEFGKITSAFFGYEQGALIVHLSDFEYTCEDFASGEDPADDSAEPYGTALLVLGNLSAEGYSGLIEEGEYPVITSEEQAGAVSGVIMTFDSPDGSADAFYITVSGTVELKKYEEEGLSAGSFDVVMSDELEGATLFEVSGKFNAEYCANLD